MLTGEINEIPPEGSLLPDTYKFERGTTRQQIVNLMKAKQREVLNQIWLRRSADVPVRTPAEMVTLAPSWRRRPAVPTSGPGWPASLSTA